jgi:hypothetical protein
MDCWFRKIDKDTWEPFYQKKITEEQLADFEYNGNTRVTYSRNDINEIVGYADLITKQYS